MEINCPNCGSAEVLLEGGGYFVCCDCDHNWKEKPQSKASHHIQTECGHFCSYHQQYECSMIAVKKCSFTCSHDDGLGALVDHLLDQAVKEYQDAKGKTDLKRFNYSTPHWNAVQELVYRRLDDC